MKKAMSLPVIIFICITTFAHCKSDQSNEKDKNEKNKISKQDSMKIAAELNKYAIVPPIQNSPGVNFTKIQMVFLNSREIFVSVNVTVNGWLSMKQGRSGVNAFMIKA